MPQHLPFLSTSAVPAMPVRRAVFRASKHTAICIIPIHSSPIITTAPVPRMSAYSTLYCNRVPHPATILTRPPLTGPISEKQVLSHCIAFESMRLNPHFDHRNFMFRQIETDPDTGTVLEVMSQCSTMQCSAVQCVKLLHLFE